MRRRSFPMIALWLFSGAAARSQPVIGAVANSASATTNVAPGSIATIYGTGVATSTAGNTVFPLPNTLGGASIAINGTPAPLYYASPGQLNFQLPVDLAPGPATAIVTAGGVASAPFPFTVLASAPGIYAPGNRAIAVNFQDGKLNSSSDPAAAGGYIIVYMTGQGAVDAAVATGQPAPSNPPASATAPYSATIGGQPATVSFLGLTPGLAGLLQANIQAPNLVTGDYPLVVTVGGQQSNAATVSVSGAGPPPGTPQLTRVGSAQITQGIARNIAVSGTTAFICGTQEIAAVDVSNPASPAVLAEFGQNDLGTNGTMCQLLGNSLIEIVNTQKLAVYYVANPAQPLLAASFDPGSPYAGYVFFVGNTGFFTTDWFRYYIASSDIFEQHGDFYAVDFSNPAQPAVVSTLANDPSQPASSDTSPRWGAVALNDQTALIASTTSTGGEPSGGTARVEVIDIGNPSSMRALGQVGIPQAAIAGAIAVQGNTALVAGNTKSWRDPITPNSDFLGVLTLTALDVSNPTSPTVVSTQVTGIQTSFNLGPILAPLGNGFFAIAIPPPADDNPGSDPPSGNGQLGVVDARDPRNLVLTTIASESQLVGLAVAGNKVYTANKTGMNIYQVQ